jgi:diguanylate cyclase (GGDEF)-like protein
VRDSAGTWAVEDLGSTNGTFVNEERINRQALRDGDQIRFGDAIFKFLIGSNVEAAYHEEIYRMTIVDGLTGVHNKRYFLDFLDREVASAHRHQHPLSLVMMDLDHFKSINDERGHLAGDAVLKEMTARVKHRIRREDLFARYGGEEFSAVLTVTPLDGAIRFAEHVRRLIGERPFEFDGQEFRVTLSLGVATVYNDATVDVLSLIKQADDNLYEAKRSGRDRIIPAFDSIEA